MSREATQSSTVSQDEAVTTHVYAETQRDGGGAPVCSAKLPNGELCGKESGRHLAAVIVRHGDTKTDLLTGLNAGTATARARELMENHGAHAFVVDRDVFGCAYMFEFTVDGDQFGVLCRRPKSAHKEPLLTSPTIPAALASPRVEAAMEMMDAAEAEGNSISKTSPRGQSLEYLATAAVTAEAESIVADWRKDVDAFMLYSNTLDDHWLIEGGRCMCGVRVFDPETVDDEDRAYKLTRQHLALAIVEAVRADA